MTDPIADMLTRIRNALRVKKSEVVIPHSKLKVRVAEILKQEGYISSFEIAEKKQELKLQLRYLPAGKPAINYLQRVSTPGRRLYYGYKDLPKVLNNLGVAIVSTPQGVMTAGEARQRKIGGEVICEIY